MTEINQLFYINSVEIQSWS